jgi:hypothetical protein
VARAHRASHNPPETTGIGRHLVLPWEGATLTERLRFRHSRAVCEPPKRRKRNSLTDD